ncbi:MAG: hypothetical protein JW937_10110 [Candidatus Omnitrophica bacterium]|nr:hypothetical protein [Candidatus Omnitrophota bacterium]
MSHSINRNKLASKLEKVLHRNPAYAVDAYGFVLEALHFVVDRLPEARHITGKELLEGIRDMGMDHYGPMAPTVFKHWNIRNTEDFGSIVFRLVEVGLLGKTEDDNIDDFKDVFSFTEAFKWRGVTLNAEGPYLDLSIPN